MGCLHLVEWNGGMEWWNGMVEWNSGMDYWTGGMLHRTYLIIQHVSFNEQWALCRVLCMHCWLDGWLVRLVLHCMNFDPGQDTPLLSGACKATKHHSMSHTWLQIVIFPFSHTVWVQSDKENSSATIALTFAFLWARCEQVRAEQPHLGECVASPDWNLATQPWHRVGYKWKQTFPNLVYRLSMGPNNCHSLCRTHKLCGGRAGLQYFCWQPQQTLIFPVMRYCSLYNTYARWLGMSYEAFHHSNCPFHYSIPPFHSTECRHPPRMLQTAPDGYRKSPASHFISIHCSTVPVHHSSPLVPVHHSSTLVPVQRL